MVSGAIRSHKSHVAKLVRHFRDIRITFKGLIHV